jgi:ectoine hydroxylase-related dioxygenase (phytanoyl-CoA dioxygenase family)
MQSKKVNLFHEHVLVKEIGSKKRTPWHQDQSYYCVNGRDNCSLWIPLDEVSKNSSPEFVIGSNKWNKQFLPTKFFGKAYEQKDDEFQNIPNIEKNRNNYNIKSWKMNIGDAVAFNFSTVHGAPENKSKNKRRAFSIRFTGDDATYIKRKGEMSPPFPKLKLKDGQALDSKTFPVLISS